jgi:large subunit ribosomal protein L23
MVMALNFFKKKEEEKQPEKKPEVLGKKAVVKKTVKTDVVSKTRKKYVSNHEILRSPHITEKATDATEINKYIFKVGIKANKIEVKKAVESNYGVDVTSVNIVNIHRKRIRVGRNEGWTNGYKKAIVSVKEGQKIEILPR